MLSTMYPFLANYILNLLRSIYHVLKSVHMFTDISFLKYFANTITQMHTYVRM